MDYHDFTSQEKRVPVDFPEYDQTKQFSFLQTAIVNDLIS